MNNLLKATIVALVISQTVLLISCSPGFKLRTDTEVQVPPQIPSVQEPVLPEKDRQILIAGR